MVSNGQIITPAGTQVYLGTTTRAKAIALNPNPSAHNAAVLEMGASFSIQIIDLISGQILQSFSPTGDTSGSFLGIAYSADGTKLLFSQDSSHVTVANVDPTTGLISSGTQVALPSPQEIGNAYPGGIAVSADGTTAYVALNANDTFGVIDLTKAQTIQRGLDLGVDYALTHSCYEPDVAGVSCGTCDSCLLRRRGFAELGMQDPAMSPEVQQTL